MFLLRGKIVIGPELSKGSPPPDNGSPDMI
jgi:hypothetical protein